MSTETIRADQLTKGMLLTFDNAAAIDRIEVRPDGNIDAWDILNRPVLIQVPADREIQVREPVPPTCPLPVIRLDLPDEPGAEYVPVLGICGEPLTLKKIDGAVLQALDRYEPSGYMVPHWQVECFGGHVLLVPDDEGNDHEITPDPALIAEALHSLGIHA